LLPDTQVNNCDPVNGVPPSTTICGPLILVLIVTCTLGGFTARLCVESLLAAKLLLLGLYAAVMLYDPVTVPPGIETVALAAPFVTVPDTTVVFKSVKLTVPPFTVPWGLVTVALSVTFWLFALNAAETFAAVVVVLAVATDKECVLSLLVVKLAAPL
jgi:hypothetical protein